MSSEQSSAPRTQFAKLTSDNYEIWINHVRDHLLPQDLFEVFECSEEEGGFEGALQNYEDAEEQAARTKKLKTRWSFLRNHLSEDIYKKTLDPSLVSFGDSVVLLRFLRHNWHSNSVFDRSIISLISRERLKQLSLETCKDMDEFVMEFKSLKALIYEQTWNWCDRKRRRRSLRVQREAPCRLQGAQSSRHVMANKMTFDDASLQECRLMFLGIKRIH